MGFSHDSIHPPPGRMDGNVRRMLRLFESHATFLQRSADGEIVHRARVIHPDVESEEHLDVILIDLWKRHTQLESYSDLIFGGAVEIRDFLSDAPLVYSSGPRLTPPGFRTVEGLREALRSRLPESNKEHES